MNALSRGARAGWPVFWSKNPQSRRAGGGMLRRPFSSGNSDGGSTEVLKGSESLKKTNTLDHVQLEDRPDVAAAQAWQRKKRKKVTTKDLQLLKKKNVPITMVSAHDYPSAVHVDLAGIDCLLVGDSLGMVELGMNTTIPVDMEVMLHHCKAVARGSTHPLLIGDMPFGSVEISKEAALKNAMRFLKEADMDCVKLEGGRHRAETVNHIVRGGIAVMGHVGLTPQHISIFGGFRAQGKTAKAAQAVLEDALRIQDAGAFAVVLECIPAEVAKVVTDTLEIPTIGIGAGPFTSGQVLVFQDLLGVMQHPHHQQFVPRFCKQYANVGSHIQRGLENFRDDVQNKRFPDDNYSPYKITEEELQKLEAWVATNKRSPSAQLNEVDESGPIEKVY